jgi:hypothetical protein
MFSSQSTFQFPCQIFLCGRDTLFSSAMNNQLKPRRLVALRRDETDFVVAFQPEDVIIFRNPDAGALRKICRQLRWEIISDTAYSVDDL